LLQSSHDSLFQVVQVSEICVLKTVLHHLVCAVLGN